MLFGTDGCSRFCKNACILMSADFIEKPPFKREKPVLEMELSKDKTSQQKDALHILE